LQVGQRCVVGQNSAAQPRFEAASQQKNAVFKPAFDPCLVACP
jgi:hypothetical protein